MKKNRAHLIFTGALAVLTLFFLFRNVSNVRFLETIKQADFRFLLISLVVLFLFIMMEALSLRTLLKSFGFQPGLRRIFRYALADFYVSSITPGACGGQPTKLYFMSRDQLPLGVSSLCVLLFNTCYHVSMLLIVAAAWFSGALQPITTHPALKWLLLYGALIQLSLVLLFITLAFSKTLAPGLLRRLIHLLTKVRLIKKPEKWLARLEEQTALYHSGSSYFKEHPGVLGKTLILTTLHLLLLYSLPYWVYRSFGLSGVSFLHILFLQAGLTIGVESLPLPGGLAANEGSFLIVFANVFPQSLLLSALLLSRGISYYLGLIIGGISTWFLNKKTQKITVPSLSRSKSDLRQIPTKKSHVMVQ